MTTGYVDCIEGLAMRDAMIDYLSELCRSPDNEDKALDEVFDFLPAMMCRNQWAEVDSFLEQINVRRLMPSVIAAILTVTSWSMGNLTRRESFVSRSREFISESKSPSEIQSFFCGIE